MRALYNANFYYSKCLHAIFLYTELFALWMFVATDLNVPERFDLWKPQFFESFFWKLIIFYIVRQAASKVDKTEKGSQKMY